MTRVPIPQRIKNKVLIEQQGFCKDCKNKLRNVEFHHIDGDNTNSFDKQNIVALCLDCHKDRHTKKRFGNETLKEEQKDNDLISNFKLPKFEAPKFEAPEFGV